MLVSTGALQPADGTRGSSRADSAQAGFGQASWRGDEPSGDSPWPNVALPWPSESERGPHHTMHLRGPRPRTGRMSPEADHDRRRAVGGRPVLHREFQAFERWVRSMARQDDRTGLLMSAHCGGVLVSSTLKVRDKRLRSYETSQPPDLSQWRHHPWDPLDRRSSLEGARAGSTRPGQALVMHKMAVSFTPFVHRVSSDASHGRAHHGFRTARRSLGEGQPYWNAISS